MILLEDLIPEYPAVDDPQIQRKLNQMPEFAELRGTVREPMPARGEYFRHQRVIARLLRVYDRLMLLHMMGVGKTGAVKSAAGFYKYKYYPLPPPPIQGGGPSDADVDTVGFSEPSAQIALGLPPPDQFGRGAAAAAAAGSLSGAGPGVSVSAFVDALVEFMGDADTDIRHAFIIVKGPGLKREFERQIACELADPGEFDAALKGVQHLPTSDRLRRQRREVGKWYTIETSRVFVRRHLCRREGGRYVLLPDEELRRRFNGCFFYVDEFQALYNEARDSAVTRRRRRGPVAFAQRETVEDFKFTYDALDRLFHVAERLKVVIGSGTPMMNSANEIKSPMNLILPESMRMPRSMNVNNMTAEELEPYFRGRVSYVRELDTGAISLQMGDHFLMEVNGREVESSERVYMTTMSEFQSSVYERTMRGDLEGIEIVDSREHSPTQQRPAARFDDEDDEEGLGGIPLALAGMDDFDAANFEDIQAQIMAEFANMQAALSSAAVRRDRAGTHFHGAEMNASVFVFPDGSLEGKVTEGDGSRMAPSGLGRYVYSPRRGVYLPTREYASLINSPEKIRRYSCVFADMLQISLERPREKAFIYLGDRVQGAGVINLGVCYSVNGFEHYHPSPSDMVDAGPIDCGRNRARRARTISLAKRPRFALLTNYTSRAEQDAIMELWNSPDNLHGEYLSHIFSSTVGGTGFNFRNTVRGHFLPGWNPSGMKQAIARILRTLSHAELLEERRAEIAARGGNPDDAHITVEIYRHAAMPINEDVLSIDLYMYELSERKDREIQRVMRVMKQAAVDCVIHYERNVRPGIDGSPECDYDVCLYECSAPPLPGVADPDLREPPPPGVTEKQKVSPLLLTLRSRDTERVAARIVEHLQSSTRARLTDLARDLAEPLAEVTAAAYGLQSHDRVVLDALGFPCLVRCLDDPVTRLVPRETGFRDVIVSLHRSFSFAPGQASDPYDGYYSDTLHVATVAPQLTSSLIDATLRASEDATGERVEYVRRISSSIDEINAMPTSVQVELFEAATEMFLRGGAPGDDGDEVMPLATARNIMWYFARYMYTMTEPVADLERAEGDLVRRGKGRGRKSRADAPLIITFDVSPATVLDGSNAVISLLSCSRDAQRCRDESRVFLHLLNSRNVDRTSYSVAAQFKALRGGIRILSMRDRVPRWRDATLSETPVYRELIQRMRDEQIESYGDLFGSLLDDKFRIHDRLASKAGARDTNEPRNRREEARGRVCETWPLEHLVSLAYRAGVEAPPEEYMSESRATPRARRDRELAEFTRRRIDAVRALPDEQSVYEYAWWIQFREKGEKVKRASARLCQALLDRFEDTGRLITT